MRADMRFVFVRGGLVAPQVVASSGVVHLAQPNQPTGVHLALTGNPRCVWHGHGLLQKHAQQPLRL